MRLRAHRSITMSEVRKPAVPSEVPVLSTAEMDAEATKIRLQSEKLKLQRELLELEKLTADLESIRAKKANKEQAAQNVQESLKFQINDRKKHEELCTHMKGGGAEDLLNGAISRGQDFNNYAMIEHTLMSGCRFRLCQRCGRTWFPMDADYKWAMSRPTKNTASSACVSPGLTTNRGSVEQGGQRLVSEIPHENVAVPHSAKNTAWSPEDSL